MDQSPEIGNLNYSKNGINIPLKNLATKSWTVVLKEVFSQPPFLYLQTKIK